MWRWTGVYTGPAEEEQLSVTASSAHVLIHSPLSKYGGGGMAAQYSYWCLTHYLTFSRSHQWIMSVNLTLNLRGCIMPMTNYCAITQQPRVSRSWKLLYVQFRSNLCSSRPVSMTWQTLLLGGGGWGGTSAWKFKNKTSQTNRWHNGGYVHLLDHPWFEKQVVGLMCLQPETKIMVHICSLHA